MKLKNNISILWQSNPQRQNHCCQGLGAEREQRNGELLYDEYSFSSASWKSSRDRVHHSVNVLTTTEVHVHTHKPPITLRSSLIFFHSYLNIYMHMKIVVLRYALLLIRNIINMISRMSTPINILTQRESIAQTGIH